MAPPQLAAAMIATTPPVTSASQLRSSMLRNFISRIYTAWLAEPTE